MVNAMQWHERISRRLRLKDLHTLQTVAEVGSMAKASERLALSQPAISKAVADMERIVGAALLERSSRGVELTPSGLLLIERARVIFDELRQGVSEIESLSDPTRGTVRVGTTEPVLGFVSEVVSALAAQYPQLRHDIMVSDLDTLVGELRERRRDVVISRWAPLPGSDDLDSRALFTSPLAVMAAKHHPLLRRRKLKLDDLMDERWTLSPASSFIGRAVVELFRGSGLPLPPTTVTTISVHMRLNLLASGGFLSVLPLQMLQYPANRAWLRPLDVVAVADSNMPIASITLKRRRGAPALALFEAATLKVARLMGDAQHPGTGG